MSECMIAVKNGEVRAAVALSASTALVDATVADWMSDPSITEIVRVPVEVARQFLFERWPGREAAIARTCGSPTDALHIAGAAHG